MKPHGSHWFPLVPMNRMMIFWGYPYACPISIALRWCQGNGSITQFPILTMPNDARSLWKQLAAWEVWGRFAGNIRDFWGWWSQPARIQLLFFFGFFSCLSFFAMLSKSTDWPKDITHPIPDLTGYITEGQAWWIEESWSEKQTPSNLSWTRTKESQRCSFFDSFWIIWSQQDRRRPSSACVAPYFFVFPGTNYARSLSIVRCTTDRSILQSTRGARSTRGRIPGRDDGDVDGIWISRIMG